MTNDLLDYFEKNNIAVFFFIRPYAPLEWKGYPFPSESMDIETLIKEQGWDKRAGIIDLRWSLYGNQFSDTLSHYTPEGSRILGKAIADAIIARSYSPNSGSAHDE